MDKSKMKVPGIRCPDCQSGNIWVKGFVPTRQGRKVRYLCVDCARTFYEPEKPKPKRGVTEARKAFLQTVAPTEEVVKAQPPQPADADNGGDSATEVSPAPLQ